MIVGRIEIHNGARTPDGAKELVQAAQAAGLKVLLVSGGFTYFAEHVRGLLGIDYVRANVLEIKGGALTGGLVEQAWGDICDGAEKRRTLLEVASLIGIDASQCIELGHQSIRSSIKPAIISVTAQVS